MEFNHILDQIQPSASIKAGLDGKPALYNLAVGSPDLPPPNGIFQLLTDFAATPDFNYQPSKGSRQAIENIHSIVLNNDPDIDPAKNIILCSGAKIGIYLSLKTIANEGDTVMLLQPHWLSYPDICRSLGLNFLSFEMDIEGMSYDIAELKDELLKNKVRVLLLNNPNNPTGHIFSNSELTEFIAFCKENNIWVILDEVYKDLSFDAAACKHSGLSRYDNLIRVGSLSKSLAFPGFRIGYVTGREAFINNYNLLNQHICTSINSFSDFIVRNLKKDIYYNFTEYCSGIYRERAERISAGLNQKGFKVLQSHAAFYLLVKVTPVYKDTITCIRELKEKGIVVTEGVHYGSQFSEYVRICITLPVEILEKVIELI